MRTALILILFCTACTPKATPLAPVDTPPPTEARAQHPFFSEYRVLNKSGNPDLPVGLMEAYVRFAEAAKDHGDVVRFVLPHAASYTYEEREPPHHEYGTKINLPFLKDHFSPQVLAVRKDSDDAWLIRTGSTALFYVLTNSGDWMVYRYLDKPIQ